MAISTNGTVIARLAGALYNQTMSSASYNEVVGSVKSAADINALANSFVSTDFAGKTDAQIATVLLTNLNLTSVAGLNNWVAAQITAAGAAGKGAKIVSLLNDFSNLTADAVYGASASSFNTKVDSALALSQTAGFKGGDLNAAATIAAAEKAVADAAAKKISDDAAAKKIIDDAAAKKIIDDAAAKKILDDAAAKKIVDDAAAKKIVDDAAAKKIVDDKAAAEKILTDAATKAATDASAAIDAATVADAALATAQTALATATTKAALTDATVLASTTKTLTDAITAATTVKTNADKAVVDANTAYTAALNATTPVSADVVNTNAAVLISTNKAVVAAKALADATAAAALAKTASDAATADDASAVTAQTAVDTSAAAATKAAAAAVASVATSKTAAAATATTADDAVATTAVTVAAAKGAGAAKIITDAAAKVEATATELVKTNAYTTAKTAYDSAVTAATSSLKLATDANSAYDTAAAAANTVALATAAQALAATSTTAAAKSDADAKLQQTAATALKTAATATASTADDTIADGAVTASATAVTGGASAVSGAATDATAAAKAVVDTAKKVVDDKATADALAIEMAPKSFTLTTGADVYVGGKGTNTVTSVIGTDGLAANGTSLNAGDNIAGGVGTADVLSVNITGNNTGLVTTAAVTLSAVENITVTNYETTANDNSINLSLAPGVSKISVLGSSLTGDTLFTGVRGLVTAEMGNGNGDLSITYVDTALAATTDVQTLNLSGQTGGSFSALPTTTGAAAAETVTITSGTSANTVLLNVPGATTINVSGASNLTLTESMTNTLTSVNATGFTGALNITTDDVTAINVIGGSGADTITLGASFGTTDTINGGGGDDTLSIATPVASAAALAGVTNVEALTVTSGDLVTLAANVSPTTFNLAQTTAAANTLTLNTGYTNATTVNLGAGDTVTNTANAVLTLNATDAGMIGSVITGGTAADTLNLTASLATTVVTLNTQAIRVDTITIVDGGDTLATAGRDISITAGLAATSVTVNASALDAGVTGATDATGENLTYVGGGVTTATVVQNVTGGGGNDTISGGAGNDIISGGSGNDSLSGGTGNDSISGGLNDDTINMAATLTSADTIDGGEGADKLILTALPALGLTNVSNVETLVLGGGAFSVSLAANVSFTTIDMDDGTTDTTAQALTLATGYTNATTVLVDAGDSVTNTANAALTITATDAKMTGTTVTGGTGADTLNITATALHAGAALTLASLITNVETINLLDGGDVTTGTVTAGSDMSLTVGNYASAATVATTLTVDASTLDAGTVTSSAMNADYENATINGAGVLNALVKLALTGGGGADSLTGGAGNDVIVGGAGNDQITPGTGNDNLSGGDDIDTFVMDVNLTFQDTINGGSGIDILTSAGGSGAGPTVVDADFTNVTLVETLTLSVGATLGAAATAAGIVTVNTPTTAAAVNAATTTTGITFNALIAGGAAQAQTLTGGTGADTFNFGSGTTTQDSLSTAETVNGGAGNDTLFISNSVAGVTAELNLNAGKVTNVENVTLGTASGLSADTAQIFALTITDITLTTVQTVAISGAAITDTKDTIAITNNATNAVGGTSFNITGGAGADTLTGGVNNDSINGGGGADSITGGLGADSLTGAGGADRFVYAATSATNVSTTIAKDTISDFTTGSDVLEVNLVATGSVGTYVGSAASLGEGMTLLSGRKGEWFYDTTTKQVHMDTDGNGLIQSTDLTINMGTLAAIAGADVALSINSDATTATTGGTGADVFIVSKAATAQEYDGGLGNDTFNATQAALTNADVLTGGGGTDTLNISGTGTTTLDSDAKLATIENINLTGTATQSLVLTNQLEAFKVQMNAAGGTVTVNATVADTLNGGAGVDNFTINTVDGHAFLPQATIAGGDGADIITLGLATTTLVDVDFANVTSVDRLVLLGASTIVLGTAATAAGIANVTTGDDTTSITSTQTALAVNTDLAATTKVVTVAGTANFTVNGAAGTVFDRLTSTSTGTVGVTFGNAGSDGITVVTGASNFTVAGTGANDVITVTGLNTANQTFNGSTALGSFAIVGGAAATAITTGVLGDTVTGAGGVDIIDTGAGNDQLIYLETADLFTAGALVDSITGGAGTADELLVGTSGTAFAIASTDVWTRSSGLEVITSVTNASAVTIALGVSAETAGINVVNISAATTSTAHLINASSYVTAGLTLTGGASITSITGGGGADTIKGGAAADVIIGGGGADSITGAGGIDALTGGAGADRFNISAITATADRDTIGDFTAGVGGDIVQLGAYTGFVLGTLVTSQTVAGKSDLANRVIIDTIANLGALGVTLGDLSGYTNLPKYAYASDTGQLFYDANGNWTAAGTSAVLIATLTVTGTVTAADNFAIITAAA